MVAERTRVQAVTGLISESRKDRRSERGLRLILQAGQILGIEGDELWELLAAMDYCEDGTRTIYDSDPPKWQAIIDKATQ